MQKDTFAIGFDSDDGRHFIYQSIGEADKNHTFKDTTKSKDGHIYAIPGRKTKIYNILKFNRKQSKTKLETCYSKQHFIFCTPDSPIDPVAIYELYVSKLNQKNPWLWQRPKRKITGTEEEWFDNIPIGPHPLENFMRHLSEKASLSKIYTNHCIRATVITNLDKAGFEACHIKAVSGHKSDETIKNYSVKCPDVKKREMSDVLSSKLEPRLKRNKPSAMITQPQEVEEDAQLPVLNVNDIVDFVPIPNNENDFDLGEIIKVVEQAEKITETNQKEENIPKVQANAEPLVKYL